MSERDLGSAVALEPEGVWVDDDRCERADVQTLASTGETAELFDPTGETAAAPSAHIPLPLDRCGLGPELRSAPMAVGQLGPDGNWLSVNTKLCDLVGIDEIDLVGVQGLVELVRAEDVGLLDDIQLGSLDCGTSLGLRRPDGTTIQVEVVAAWKVPDTYTVTVMIRPLPPGTGDEPHSPALGPDPVLPVMSLDAPDATSTADVLPQDEPPVRSGEEQLRRLALHDPLTGLANRLLLVDRVEQACARAERNNTTMALMVVDVDDFEGLNRTHGLRIADHVLVELSERMKATVRPSDTVARIGRDEFIVLCEGLDDEHQALQMLSRVRERLNEKRDLVTDALSPTVSIGLHTTGGANAAREDAAQLLANAETALDQARAGGGRARYEVFSEDLRTYAKTRIRMEAELRRALDNREFELAYQPVVELATGRIAGFEALVRWNHPVEGMLPPSRFLETAEQVPHLVCELGEQVLEAACDEIARRRERHPDLWVAVNVSAHQLGPNQFSGQVERALTSRALSPDALRIELTESVFVHNEGDTALEDLGRIQALGVRLAIDDFGTGYSALAYLQQIPFDELKIDQAFVSDMQANQISIDIVKAIISLGRARDACVIAEGIEDCSQLQILRDLGCDYGQGHLFGRAEVPDGSGDWARGAFALDDLSVT